MIQVQDETDFIINEGKAEMDLTQPGQ